MEKRLRPAITTTPRASTRPVFSSGAGRNSDSVVSYVSINFRGSINESASEAIAQYRGFLLPLLGEKKAVMACKKSLAKQGGEHQSWHFERRGCCFKLDQFGEDLAGFAVLGSKPGRGGCSPERCAQDALLRVREHQAVVNRAVACLDIL